MEAVTMDDTHRSVGSCFLFPPRPVYRWLNPLWWPSYLRVLWDEWWVQPTEPFCLEKRIGIMMESHNDFEERIKKKYPPNSLYYLEIAAVRPDTQGMGVGKTIMQWVVQKIGDYPCYIECTDRNNVAFYVKYGFEVVEEKKLVDEEDAMPPTTLFYMIRDTSALKK
ncbi:GNAT family [Fusarium oxysporum f. sp. phaseoli]